MNLLVGLCFCWRNMESLLPSCHFYSFFHVMLLLYFNQESMRQNMLACVWLLCFGWNGNFLSSRLVVMFFCLTTYYCWVWVETWEWEALSRYFIFFFNFLCGERKNLELVALLRRHVCGSHGVKVVQLWYECY